MIDNGRIQSYTSNTVKTVHKINGVAINVAGIEVCPCWEEIVPRGSMFAYTIRSSDGVVNNIGVLMGIALFYACIACILYDITTCGGDPGQAMTAQITVLDDTVGEFSTGDKVIFSREHSELAVFKHTIVVEG